MSKLIEKTCDYCGKTKKVYASRQTGKVFFTCSQECKHIMTGRYNKKRWDDMDPDQKEDQISKTLGKVDHTKSNHTKNLLTFWEGHNKKMLDITISAMKSHDGFISVKEREKLKISKSPCVLLKAHAALMKDDPKSLTTKFCQDLIGIKCNHDKDTTNL